MKDDLRILIAANPTLALMLARALEPMGCQVEIKSSFLQAFEAAQQGVADCVIAEIPMLQSGSATDWARLQKLSESTYVVLLSSTRQGVYAFSIDSVTALEEISDVSRIEALVEILKKGAARVGEQSELVDVQTLWQQRYDTLSPRERQVMERVVNGMLNKQIAADLGLSPKTIEVHRANVMSKMQVESLAELVRVAVLLGQPAGNGVCHAV